MLTVGVDIGGTNVRAGVVNAQGEVLDRARTRTPTGEDELDDAITTVLRTLTARHPIHAVGLAVAGFVTEDRRAVRFAPHLAWRDAPLVERLSDRWELPVVLEHDANAALWAEYLFGAARDARVAVMITLGTGIGAALLTHGALYRGAYGVAPELAHLTLVRGGRPCACGKHGCWERYCGGTALAATAVELLAGDDGTSVLAGQRAAITGRLVAAAAQDGDPLAARAMEELAWWLGEGLAAVADLYDPQVVVIGGGVAASAPLFLDAARQRFADALTGGRYRSLASIRTARLGGDAAVVGAAILAGQGLA